MLKTQFDRLLPPDNVITVAVELTLIAVAFESKYIDDGRVMWIEHF